MNAILTRDSSSGARRTVASPVDRRKRSPRARADRTLRARADAAIINQWLSEQATPPREPKAPAPAA
jgi:hypothetical protein